MPDESYVASPDDPGPRSTWAYWVTPFPTVSGGQRPVLRTLRAGVLLVISFTPGSSFRDDAGHDFMGQGMFAALSEDGGATWPVRKLLTDGNHRRLQGRGWTGEFMMDATHAEPKGCQAAVQTRDCLIPPIFSGLHHRFNAAWQRQRNAPEEPSALTI